MQENSYNYKLLIQYDGTCYSGWQIQDNADSIQSQIEQAIKTILRIPVRVIGSGRTDAGVHALGQTAHFHVPCVLDLYRFLRSLNGILPADIRVINGVPVPLDFHAQYSAIGKIYHYRLCLDKIQSPFNRYYTFQVHAKIDLDKLKEAAQCFIGTHDFTSFANEAHTGSASKDPIRTLNRLDIVPESGGIRLEFEADGFLYKMVRNIVGTLLEVASGKLAKEEIERILAAKDRRAAGAAVSPQGLFLVQVNYPSSSIELKDG
jgi:tRNA pseudouridine38-40 synthase